MKKVIRLNESQLITLINSVIEEQGVKRFIGKLFKTGTKDSKVAFKEGIPLINQLPTNVQIMIKSLPKEVKVGPKLEELFKNNYSRIKSLEGKLKKYGLDDLYARKLSDAVSKPRGSVVNFQDLYTHSNFLKKELENLKSGLVRPKEGGLLNKNPNYKKQLDDWYNALHIEIGDVNRFISDLNDILKKK